MRLGITLGKFVDVCKFRAAPPENTLRVVADDHHVAMFDSEQVNNFGLQPVGVLIFVNENMLELFGVKVGDFGFSN